MERKGLRRPAFELLIASHALHRDAAVATLDPDYEGIQGLKVVRVKA